MACIFGYVSVALIFIHISTVVCGTLLLWEYLIRLGVREEESKRLSKSESLVRSFPWANHGNSSYNR